MVGEMFEFNWDLVCVLKCWNYCKLLHILNILVYPYLFMIACYTGANNNKGRDSP